MIDKARLEELKQRVTQSITAKGTRAPKLAMMKDLLTLIDDALIEPCEWCREELGTSKLRWLESLIDNSEVRSAGGYLPKNNCPNCGRDLRVDA